MTAGCGTSPDADAYSAVLNELRSNAALANVSENQLKVLDSATRSGGLEITDLTPLFEDYAACLESGGWSVTNAGPVEVPDGSGLFSFEFVAIPPSGWTERQAGDFDAQCGERHWAYANAAYNSSPHVREKRDAPWKSEAVIACLRERGHEVDDDATGTEINQIAAEDELANMDVPGYVMCDPYPH